MTQAFRDGAHSEAVDPRGQPEASTQVGSAGVAGAPATGLVCNATSDTYNLNSRQARLSRLRRSLFVSTKLINDWHQENCIRHRKAFITVTYAHAGEWSPRHITALIMCYRSWAKRHSQSFKLRYVWVAEIQRERYYATRESVVHYHLVLWLPRGITPPLPDNQGWWPHGSSNAKWVINPVGYLAKYLSKGDGPYAFPSGCRLYGYGGLDSFMRIQRTWLMAPRWLRELTAPNSVVKRIDGGWWDKTGGWWYRSPWSISEFRVTGPVLRWNGWGPDDIELRGSVV